MAETVYASDAPDLIIETIAMWCDDETLARLACTCRRIYAICSAEKSHRPPPPVRVFPLPGLMGWLSAQQASEARTDVKVTFLGDNCSGKTALVERLRFGSFTPPGMPTIGAAYLPFIKLVEGHRVGIQMWDTAGNERFDALAPIYYRGSSLCVITMSVGDPQSLFVAKRWHSRLMDWTSSQGKQIGIILAACMIDRGWHSAEFRRECVMFCREKRIAMIECSALTGDGIERVSDAIAIEALNYLFSARTGAAIVPAAPPAVLLRDVNRRPTKACIIS